MKSRIIIAAAVVLLFAQCKSEKKAALYDKVYSETPVTILIVPVNDNAKRQQVKTTQDSLVNEEYTTAALYMGQTLATPLLAQGYYTPAPLASELITKKLGLSFKQLRDQDIKQIATQYGIDAVLLTSIHKWKEPEVNEVAVYAEYILRSTKSGQELMHTWVCGRKLQPVNTDGEPVELSTDADFIVATGLPSELAHRCILLENMNRFVLGNLPTSVSRWYFKHDKYIAASPDYYGFVINPDGTWEQTTYSEDSFGNECFTD